MYDEYDAYLDELLEEAYLEGYYDSIDDMDDYYESNMSPGRIKKLRARNKAKKDKLEARFDNALGLTSKINTPDGQTQYVKGDPNNTRVVKYKKMPPMVKMLNQNAVQTTGLPVGRTLYSADDNTIYIPRNTARMKGSDLVGLHEHQHSKDINKILKMGNVQQTMDNINAKYNSGNFNQVSPADMKKIGNIQQSFNNNRIAYAASQPYSRPVAELKHNLKQTKNVSLNRHDRDPLELIADANAIKNAKGQNNPNRFRKSLNEINRREAQSMGYPYTDRSIKNMVNQMDTNRINVAKQLTKYV